MKVKHQMEKEKIRIPLPEGSFSGETLWSEKIEGGLFRICNVPFMAKGYAEGDIVSCQYKDGFNEVLSIEKDGGNGTLRLLFSDSQSDEAQLILRELKSVGCSYESASSQLVGVTIPSNLEVPFSQLSNFLNETEDKILTGWEVAKKFTRKP